MSLKSVCGKPDRSQWKRPQYVQCYTYQWFEFVKYKLTRKLIFTGKNKFSWACCGVGVGVGALIQCDWLLHMRESIKKDWKSVGEIFGYDMDQRNKLKDESVKRTVS